MKQIPLTQGKFALVDDEDFEFLSQWKWFADHSHGYWYAGRKQSMPEGSPVRQRTLKMHKVLLMACGTTFGDHKDGNGLNNQKSNLRPATQQQNGFNRRINATNRSGFKGVSWCKATRKWRAMIGKDGKVVYLGSFPDRLTAAKAYDTAAVDLFGEFAKTNEMLNLI